MVVVIGEKCPTRVKGRGIVRAGEMSGGTCLAGVSRGKCPTFERCTIYAVKFWLVSG